MSESIAQFYNKVLWKYTFLLTSTYIGLFFGYIEIFYPWVFIYFFECFCALHSLTRKRAILCGDKVCVFLCCLLYTTITPIVLSNAFDWPTKYLNNNQHKECLWLHLTAQVFNTRDTSGILCILCIVVLSDITLM